MTGILTDCAYPLPGDDQIRDARKQVTRTLTIDAAAEVVWPLLMKMALLDGDRGGAVLRIDAPRALLLGALYDACERRYLSFDAPRPGRFWQATWALVLTPLDADGCGCARTRLDVRSRVAFTDQALRWSSIWTHPFHDFMDPAELYRLRRASEHARPGGRRTLGRILGQLIDLVPRVTRG